MKPDCAYCHNKISDNDYVWIVNEQKLVHKVCRIITSEMRKDVVVSPSPVKMGTNARR